MRILLVMALLAATTAAQAAEITVLAAGIASGGIKTLAAAWGAETGNTATITVSSIGRVKSNAAGDAPADLALLPAADFSDIAAKLKGKPVPVGVCRFGLAVKTGAPHPDISTLPKFIAALRASSGIAYPDPSGGSLSGAKVAAMLTRPDFAGVKGIPVHAMPQKAIIDGLAPYAGGTLSEEIAPGVDVVGPFPKALGFDIDIGAAVLAKSAAPEAAASFLAYISLPEARATWKAAGIDAPE